MLDRSHRTLNAQALHSLKKGTPRLFICKFWNDQREHRNGCLILSLLSSSMHNYLMIKVDYTDQKKLLLHFFKFKLNKWGVSFLGECTLKDLYRPQHISCWKWLPRSLFRTKLCHRMGSTIPCRGIFRPWSWDTIFWEILCGGLFRYYLPGSYKFNCVIAITETGCDTGYFRKSRVAACFGITCQAVINSKVLCNSYYHVHDRVWYRISWN